ncbi:hypothetical protein BV20DRAFT_153020 [Pilatotrama ljubarskyi]|nr:hypothetical protein BV20DRAFT_153020 [Pilatotrama ljubarskyi]
MDVDENISWNIDADPGALAFPDMIANTDAGNGLHDHALVSRTSRNIPAQPRAPPSAEHAGSIPYPTLGLQHLASRPESRSESLGFNANIPNLKLEQHGPSSHSDDHVDGIPDIQAHADYSSSIRAERPPNVPAGHRPTVHAEHPQEVGAAHPSNFPAEHPANVRAEHPREVRAVHPSSLAAGHLPNVRAEVRAMHPSNLHAEHPANVRAEHPHEVRAAHPSSLAAGHLPNVPAEVRTVRPSNLHAEHPANVRAEHAQEVGAAHPSNLPVEHLPNVRAEVRAVHPFKLPAEHPANVHAEHPPDVLAEHPSPPHSTHHNQAVLGSYGDSDDEDPPRAIGRISHESLKHLDAAYELVLDKAKDVRDKTGLSVAQIFEHWLASRSRSRLKPNLWNLYGAYFKENTAQELARLHVKDRQEDQDPVPSPARSSDSYDAADQHEDEESGPSNQGHMSGTRRLCYKAFKEDYGEDKAKAILETFRQLQGANAGQSQTVAQRRTIFKKHSAKLADLMNAGEELHGFSGALLLVGSSVNSDAGLATVHMTKNAEGFFEEKCRADEDIIIGHMRALVYHNVSQYTVNLAWDTLDVDEREAPSDAKAPRERPSEGALKTSRREISTPLATSKRRAPSPIPSPAKSAGNADGDSDADLLMERKERPKYITSRLRTLLDDAGVKGISGSLFPWKSLPSILASNGVVLRNWPENVPWPLEPESTTTKSSKGISSLKSNQLVALLGALKDEKHRLKFEAHQGNRIDLIKSRIPVMHGVPPPYSSAYACGRRLFANGTTDRAGLPRLTAPLSVQLDDKSQPELPESSGVAFPGADVFGSPDSSSSPSPIQTRSKAKKAHLPFKMAMVTIDTSPNKRRAPQTNVPPEIVELSSGDEYRPSDTGLTDQPSKRTSKKRKAPPSFIASDDSPNHERNPAMVRNPLVSKGKARAMDVGMRERTPTPAQKRHIGSSGTEALEDREGRQPAKKRVRHIDAPDSVLYDS